MGQPHDETIILSHALLYLPLRRSDSLIDQASKLGAIRQLLREGKYEEAAQIPASLRKEADYNDERDPFIPAFDVRISQQPSNIVRYRRSVNFETGEASVDWQDGIGTFRRTLFASRPDSVIVLSIRGTARISCTIGFEGRPVEWNQWDFVNAHIQSRESSAEGAWLHYRTEFRIKNSNSICGYEGLGRVVTVNGKVTSDGHSIRITDADEVLLLIKIAPSYNEASQSEKMKKQLTMLGESYAALLARHTAVHAALFNRVRFELGPDDKDRALYNEEILLKARDSISTGLLMRTFDAGRYNIISCTGSNPPNLQGLWSGTWTAPWTGGMTQDGNLPTAISMNLPGRMPELMNAYFNYHEGLLDDYRKSAKRLFNCRGIHVPAQTTTTGLDTDFGPVWCLTFWTGGAGWVSSFFWDYYQYTLDRNFLQRRAYPFMKEAALFYEDFLQTGSDGKYIFSPSYSPENNPANSKSQAVINATMDVMIAKQLFRNCIAAAGILKVDADKIAQWKKMLDRMPAYEVNEDGALREWLWQDLKDNYRHRHASQLYALFDEIAPEFRSDARLRAGANKVIDEKLKFRAAEGGGEMAFGLVQLGAAAAHLGEGEKVYGLVQWLASKYWTTGMGSYHNVGGLFNMDISGGLPYLVSQMLAYSERGHVSLLPALPREWKSGRIEGLLLRGNIILEELRWSEDSVSFRLQTPVAQTVRVRFPFPVRIDGRPKATDSFELVLQANKAVVVTAARLKNKL